MDSVPHMSMTARGEIPPGPHIDARQKSYPMELSSAEIYVHLAALNEYRDDFVRDLLAQSRRGRPCTRLIDQQPRMPPHRTRHAMVSFLYQLALACSVTSGVFPAAVRLYDRYTSKRVVLAEQSKLVAATCLWLAAKSLGGCDHALNDHAVPTGARFHGPTPRARLPRLSELVFYCGGAKLCSKSMFLQMERHILHTLGWDVCRPTLHDLLLNIDENCLIQYEGYKRALLPRRNAYRAELTQIDNKIELIDVKMFLADLVAWQYPLLDYEMHDVANAVFRLIARCVTDNCPSFVQCTGDDSAEACAIRDKLDSILVDAVCDAPACLLASYKKSAYVRAFCSAVREAQCEVSPARAGSIATAFEKVPAYAASNYSSPASSAAMTFSEISLDDKDSDSDSDSEDSLSRRESTSQSAASVFSAHGASRGSTPLSAFRSRQVTHQSSPLAAKSKMSQTIAAHSVYLSNDHLRSKVSL